MAEAAVKKEAKKRTRKPKSENGENGETKEAGSRARFRARTIKVIAAENPKRQGSASAERFALYKTGMTVAQFLEAGGTMGDIAWDVKAGHIELSKE